MGDKSFQDNLQKSKQQQQPKQQNTPTHVLTQTEIVQNKENNT